MATHSHPLASFLTDLLHDNLNNPEACPNGVCIQIVDDNAQVPEKARRIGKSRSLDRLQQHKSARQLNRWSNHDQARDKGHNSLSAKGFSPPRPNIRTTTSDTQLLKMPTRKESPRITMNRKSIAGSSNSRNASWDNRKNNNLILSPDLVGGHVTSGNAEPTRSLGEASHSSRNRKNISNIGASMLGITIPNRQVVTTSKSTIGNSLTRTQSTGKVTVQDPSAMGLRLPTRKSNFMSPSNIKSSLSISGSQPRYNSLITTTITTMSAASPRSSIVSTSSSASTITFEDSFSTYSSHQTTGNLVSEASTFGLELQV